MSDVQTKTVARLNEKVEALEQERNKLQRRVWDLERGTAQTEMVSEDLAPPLMAELLSLRASEEILRQQLCDSHRRVEEATAEAEKLAKEDIHAARLLSQMLETVEKAGEDLNSVEIEREVLRLQLQELQGRRSVEHTLREAQLQDLLALSQSSIQNLLLRLAAVEAREAQAHAEVAAHQETVEKQQRTIQNIPACDDTVDEVLASKRRRLESEIFDNPNSVRRELVTFWNEGREEIRRLQEEVRQLRTETQQMRPLREKLRLLERNRSTVVARLVDLADEVSRVREEKQRLRAQCSGLEVERDFLRSSLATIVSGIMQEEELSNCCAAVREAAVRSAAASASIVVDPQVFQQTLREAQELQSEVVQLSKQSEKLHRCIALREERLAALITREAVLMPRSTGQEETDTLISQGAEGVPPDAPVTRKITWAQAKASDVITCLEGPPATAGKQERVNMFTDLQARADAAEQQVRRYKEQLELVTRSRDDVEARLLALRTEMQTSLQEREAVMVEMHNSNTTLLQSVNTLQSGQKRLRECYDASVSFAQKLASALGALLRFVRGETNLTVSASRLVQQHRTEICKLTYRVTDAWEERKDDIQFVAESIERMCEYIAQSAEQHKREQGLKGVEHLRRLTDAVKQQEERLKDIQDKFTHTCRQLGESLANRVTESQKHADSLWAKRVGALLDERNQLQGQLMAERDLLSRIERSMMVAAATKPPETIADTATNSSNILDGPDHDSTNEESGNQLLDVINQLHASLSQLQSSGAIVELLPAITDGEGESVEVEANEEEMVGGNEEG
uniref:WGS project CAEQ00000000 data, annotated contig 1891 n=1 Tax=Trypanosoma congolense (strain IL3000) TaxID=1068625 RepID=F9W9T2_TRYCI|nr:unnamed protein product [Trypanosoma congolense IL3000]